MIKTIKPSKVSLFDNSNTHYTIKRVKALTGADYVFNGGIFNMKTLVPYCDMKIDGVVKSNDADSYFGYGWKNGELPKVVHSNDMGLVDNYVSCLWVIHNGEKLDITYPADMGGSRGRTAFGYKLNGEMVIVCTDDKSPITIEQARDKLFANGCVSGIVLDGGGSSQIDTPDDDITSARIVSNFVCVTLDKTDKTVPIVNDKKEDDIVSALNIVQPKYAWAYPATLRTKTTHIVLHHVGVVGSFTVEQIHAEHLRKKWRGIAYNYYVRKDGTIYHGREENAAGGHTLGYNEVSIGICFEGNFEVETMTDAQLVAGQKLIADILTRYSTAKVVRHSDLNRTACPGKNFPFDKMTAVAQPTGKIYRVQVGAYSAKTNADLLAAELKKKGYQAIIVEG